MPHNPPPSEPIRILNLVRFTISFLNYIQSLLEFSSDIHFYLYHQRCVLISQVAVLRIRIIKTIFYPITLSENTYDGKIIEVRSQAREIKVQNAYVRPRSSYFQVAHFTPK